MRFCRLAALGVSVPLALIEVTVSSAPVLAETLAEALADAYSSNPRLLSARARLRATDERVPQALSNWRPTVSLSARQSFANKDVIDEDETTNTDTWPFNNTLSISQPLFRGFRTVAETERAESQILAERARLVGTEQDVLFDGVSAYMNVVRDRAVLELNTRNVEVLRRQLQATEDRFRVGELTRTDVAQAQSRLQRAIADLVNARGDLTSSIANYINIIGHDPGVLDFPPPVANLPASEAAAIEAARTANPDVLAADYDERAAQADIRLTRGEFLPTLSVAGDVTYNTDWAEDNTDTITETLATTLNVPLYQAGGVHSRLRSAKHTASQRKQDYFNAQRGAVEAATRAWENLQTALASVEAFEAEVRAQEIAYQGVQEEARVGARTTLDVLDAEQELFNAQVNLVRFRRDAVVAAYEVFGAVGRLSAADLGLPTQVYDPRANYNRVRNRWFGTAIEDQVRK